jgi:hypothetical protein
MALENTVIQDKLTTLVQQFIIFSKKERYFFFEYLLTKLQRYFS